MSFKTTYGHENRIGIIDVLRGFALIGVLIVNFTSYISQQTPQDILKPSSSSIDPILISMIDVFFEWKFMTLFSILFGYGFGILMTRFENKSLNPSAFFIRRMSWLFVMGMIHTLFWWGDILHLYAVSGVMLLLFRKTSQSAILFCSVLFLLVIPICISWLFRNQPETFTEDDIASIYGQYKYGNLPEIFRGNLIFYYKNFIRSGSDLHDIAETLGRFLFGYFLLRAGFFESIASKKALVKKILMVSFPFMILYFVVKSSLFGELFQPDSYSGSVFMTVGIFSTTFFYASGVILLYISFRSNAVFSALQSLGRMTLTNYLSISAFLIVLLYGVGFGQLGEISVLAILILPLREYSPKRSSVPIGCGSIIMARWNGYGSSLPTGKDFD